MPNIKSILMSITILLFACASALGADISRDEFMKLLNELKAVNKKVDTLSQENKVLRREINTLKVQEPSAQNGNLGDLQEEVAELSELMTTVERKTILDRIQFGAEVRTRADWFDYKERVADRGRSYRSGNEEEVHALMSNRFRLNLKAKINKNLQFHGRLTMYKNWMDNDYSDF
ncbi:MAG: DUF3373 family protein, partial [Deltaproteobacteria bacterium]|nr:DUF3373 family protein [Deltaproteobacteria bacterium]